MIFIKLPNTSTKCLFSVCSKFSTLSNFSFKIGSPFGVAPNGRIDIERPRWLSVHIHRISCFKRFSLPLRSKRTVKVFVKASGKLSLR